MLRTGALVLAVFVAVPSATTLLSVVLGVVDWRPAPDAAGLLPLVLPLAVLGMLTVTGEEIGWRGALHTTLARYGLVRATVGIGGLWTLWHLPLLVAYHQGGAMAGREVVATTVNLLVAALVLGAARALSASVWPAAWAHALLNTTLVYASSNLVTPAAELSDPAFWMLQVVAWAVLGAAGCSCCGLRGAAGQASASAADQALLRHAEPHDVALHGRHLVARGVPRPAEKPAADADVAEPQQPVPLPSGRSESRPTASTTAPTRPPTPPDPVARWPSAVAAAGSPSDTSATVPTSSPAASRTVMPSRTPAMGPCSSLIGTVIVTSPSVAGRWGPVAPPAPPPSVGRVGAATGGAPGDGAGPVGSRTVPGS